MKELTELVLDRVKYIQSLVETVDSFPIVKISNLVDECIYALKNANKIAFVGNGGSAAEAIHLAAEFTGKCVIDHPPLSAICLNESQSSLTAIGNDFGFDQVFSRQVKAQLTEGDILIAMSTSGKSKNILNAIAEAKRIGVKSYLWTGAIDLDLENVDIWQVPDSITPRIQEIHLMWGHIVAELVENQFKY